MYLRQIKKLSIVIPVYNENARLDRLFKYIERFKGKRIITDIEYIFVNDGSTDKTFKKIKEFCFKRKNRKYVSYKNNRGKGFAVKKGIIATNSEWILILDCDLSVKIEQLQIWIKKKMIFNNLNTAYFGSRLLNQSTTKRSIFRRLIGFFFRVILNFFLNIKIKDTQCGFKLFHKNYIKKVSNKLKIDGYSFDIELYLRLTNQRIKVVELPLKWEHKNGSKINFLKDTIIMIIEIIKIKKILNK